MFVLLFRTTNRRKCGFYQGHYRADVFFFLLKCTFFFAGSEPLSMFWGSIYSGKSRRNCIKNTKIRRNKGPMLLALLVFAEAQTRKILGKQEQCCTYDFWAAIPAGVLEAGLPLLVGPVPEPGVLDLPWEEHTVLSFPDHLEGFFLLFFSSSLISGPRKCCICAASRRTEAPAASS